MKIKKLVSVLVICLLMVATYTFCGCTIGFKGYEVTDLETAYEKGYITQEDLKSIAYYYNNYYNTEPPEPDFELIPKKKLSKQTIKKLKTTYLIKSGFKDGQHSDVTVDNIDIFLYYGTYNNYAVVWMRDNVIGFDPAFWKEKEIGGVVFYNLVGLPVYDLNS